MRSYCKAAIEGLTRPHAVEHPIFLAVVWGLASWFALDVHLYINQNLGRVRGLASLTTKTISISEELYQLLEKMRLPGERFDDTILRLCGVKARGKDFEASFEKALNEVVSEDAELLERLAH